MWFLESPEYFKRANIEVMVSTMIRARLAKADEAEEFVAWT